MCFTASRWGGQRLEPVRIVRNGVTIGAAVVIVLLVPGTGSGIAIVKWGPLWRPHGQAVNPDNLRVCLQLLKDEYADRRGLFLSLLPQVDPDHLPVILDVLSEFGCVEGTQLAFPERYFVNTSITSGELLTSLDQKWRYNLNRSHKTEFTFDLAKGSKHLPAFMHLYDKMISRKNFHDTSAISTLASLTTNEVEAHQPWILIVSHDGAPTTGAVIDTSGDCAVYLYGASDERALPLRAGYAMQWWIAKWLCEDPQIKWYDLGGCDGDRGLHQFKKGFVGKRGLIIQTPASADICNSTFSCLLAKSIFAVRDIKGLTTRQLHSAKARLGA